MGMDMHTKADHHYQRRGTKENDADNSATDGLSNELAQGAGGGLLYVEGISIDYLGTLVGLLRQNQSAEMHFTLDGNWGCR